MNAQLIQTIIALAIVAFAFIYLVRRMKNSGGNCGGGCDCAKPQQLKRK